MKVHASATSFHQTIRTLDTSSPSGAIGGLEIPIHDAKQNLPEESPNAIQKEFSGTRSPTMTAKPQIQHGRILIPCPRGMDSETLKRCMECARNAGLLQQNNVITAVWAGRLDNETTGDSYSVHSFHSQEVCTQYQSILIIQLDDIVNQQCPAMKAVVEECKEMNTPLNVKLYPKSSLSWILQQEFQASPASNLVEHSLVILPCWILSDKHQPDYALEKFVLDHSPVPVALIRCPD